MKLRAFLKKWEIPFEKIEKIIPKKGKILDIGCGEGLIAIFLAKKSPRRNLIGMDNDETKIRKAKKNAGGVTNIEFKNLDIFDFKFPKVDGVILSDFLHHQNFEKQKKLLKKILQNLQKGGVCLIKDVNKEDFLKARLTRLWDFLLYPGDRIYFWQAKDLIVFLESLGFSVKMNKEKIFFPGSVNLFVCQKK